MNTQRFFEAMAFKLSLDQKKLDDELERVVNSDITLDERIEKVAVILQKMVTVENVVKKFNEVIQATNNNNKNDNKLSENKNLD